MAKPRTKSKSKKPKGQGTGAPAAEAVPTGWRATLPIHPAAWMIPPMTTEELNGLVEDIEANGLIAPIPLWQAEPEAPLQLLTGRSRLDAIEIITGPLWGDAPHFETADGRAFPFRGGVRFEILDGRVIDPYAYVASSDLQRRHLTTAAKRNRIAALLKADPSKSDRQIGREIGADNKTIASVRAEEEAREEIPHVEKRTDKTGRAQPAKKAKPKKAPDQPPKASDEALRIREAAAKRIQELLDGSAKPRSDIDDPDADDTPPPSTGPNSPKPHVDYVKFLRSLPEDRCFEVLKRLCADVSHFGFTLRVSRDGEEPPETGGGRLH
jgi:hypothetical protein